MANLRDLPIRQKLTLVTVVTSGIALLLGCGLFAIFEQNEFKRGVARDFGIIADMFVDNVSSGLAFDDSTAIEHALKTLAVHPRIVAAAVYHADGHLVARYQRSDLTEEFSFPAPHGTSQRFESDRLDSFRDVVIAGESAGSIYIGCDLVEIDRRIWRYVVIILGLLGACSVVAYLLAKVLQKIISDPLMELARTAQAVAQQKNYSLRVQKKSSDEVGQLVDGFNEMLSQIQSRDAELQAANDHLEKRVETRTAQLRQAQEETLRERARFQFIFESVPVGISMVVSTRGKRLKLLINDAHLRICGITREQADEAGIFLRMTHPDDARRQAVLTDEINRGLRQSFTLEKRYVRPDGKVVWVVFSFQQQMYPDGTHEGVSTIVDITTLKHAREQAAQRVAQLRFIFDAVPVGVAWLYRHSDRVEDMMNGSFFRISGLKGERAVRMDDLRRITPPEDLVRQDEARARLDNGEVDEFSLEKRYIHPDGKTVWVDLTTKVFRELDGRILQEVSTAVDITARKESEAERETLNRQLVETSRQAGMAEVATGVLHNVGNVLNSVNVSANLVLETLHHSKSGNLERVARMLREQTDIASFVSQDPKGRKIPGYLGELAETLGGERQLVITELGHLLKHIEHIKDIVAMQQNFAKVSGHREPVRLVELVDDALRMNASGLARHEIEIVKSYVANPMIAVERHKVMQILVNLIRNAKHACQASDQRLKRITLAVASAEQVVRVVVSDNGVGIPAENLNRIFSHGFTTRRDGHGFGLHSSALVAKEMEGAIIARSDGLGLGAEFTLQLPLSDVSLS